MSTPEKKVKTVVFERIGPHNWSHDHDALLKSLPEGLTENFKVRTSLSRTRVAVYVYAPNLKAIPEALRPGSLTRPSVSIQEVDIREE